MTCAALIATQASAQSLPTQSVVGGPAMLGPSAAGLQRQVERQQADRAVRERTRWAARQTPERRERAERLSGMVNAGRCTEAVAVAREEHDEEMALRLNELCPTSPATPQPAN
jgi:prephenate dehydrogenase